MSFFTVLVVEDYLDMVDSYQSALEDTDVRWFIATTISEAKKVIQDERFDLVILDGNVPATRDGTPVSTHGLLELIRKSFDGPILCCASDKERRKEQLLLAGGNSFCCEKWDAPDKVRELLPRQ